MINRVDISKAVEKALDKMPARVRIALERWAISVETVGLEETRRIGGKGLHDEPLKGTRKGQYSIRLAKSYRAFYVILDDGTIEFVKVIEVNKHDY